jgi:hypothetical protein
VTRAAEAAPISPTSVGPTFPQRLLHPIFAIDEPMHR